MTLPASINTGQVTMTSTAALIVAARPSRRKLKLSFNTPGSSSPIALGDSTVSTTSGFLPLVTPSIGGGTVELETSSAIYGIATGSNCLVSFIETYD